MLTITMPEWFAYIAAFSIAIYTFECGLKLYGFYLKKKLHKLTKS